MEVVGEAEDGPEALALIERLRPDVAVVDLALKTSSGFDLIQQIRQRSSATAVLVLSMYSEEVYAERVLRAGGAGYVMKQEAPRKVIGAVRQVASGGTYVSEELATRLEQPPAAAPVGATPEELLSDRELQVFQLLGEGYAHAQIAERLTVSIKTVESHVERIRRKLNLPSGRQLLREAVAWTVRLQRGDRGANGRR